MDLSGISRAAIWGRVSSDDQVENGSLSNHMYQANKYCDTRNWPVVEVYLLEGVSGKTLINHPEAQRMMFDASKRRFDAIVLSAVDRLGRDVLEILLMQRHLAEHGVRIIFMREDLDLSTTQGMRRFIDLANEAQSEIMRLSERVLAGLETKMERGDAVTKCPFGYTKSDKRFVLDPQEEPIVRLIFALYLEHRKLKYVADLINGMGAKTREGNAFKGQAIKRILRAEAVTGTHIANKWGPGKKLKPKSKWIEQAVPQIIPPEEFAKVQRILAENKVIRPPKTVKRAYSGLAKCPSGTPMYFRAQRTGENARYYCRCCRASVPYAVLDTQVGGVLVGFSFADLPADAELIRSVEDPRAALLRSVVTELADIEKRKQKRIALFDADALTLADFKAENAKLDARKELLAGQRVRLEHELRLTEQSAGARASAKEALKQIVWAELDEQDKSDLLKPFVKAIVIEPAEIRLHLHYVPDEVLGDDLCKGVAAHVHGNPFAQNVIVALKRPDISVVPTGRYLWGWHVKAARKKQGVTVEHAAREIGASTSAVTHWECGASLPSVRRIPGIIAFIGFVPLELSPYQSALTASIRFAREIMGLNHQRLADRAGVDLQTIQRAELKSKSKPATLTRISRALGVPFSRYLLPGGWLNPA